MLEEAVRRIEPLVGPENVYVATSAALHRPVAEAGIVAAQNLWWEPTKRNTLGALCWVVAQLLAKGEEDVLVAALTADHQIGTPDRFRETVDAALDLAETHDSIVTIGVPPNRPETGYGYIEADLSSAWQVASGREGFTSKSFREKPDLDTAQRFLDAGGFLWNAGMYFFSVSAFLRELRFTQPGAYESVLRMVEALAAGDQAGAQASFEELPSISVDFAVMEKAERILVIPADFPWDDVGAWDALERTLPAQESGTVVQGEAIVIDSRGCIVVNDSASVSVGVLGVDEVVVVVTDRAVLVCSKANAQRVREVTSRLSK